MCGIFAYQSKDIDKTNWKEVIANFKILGLYNDSRGGDNVGFYVNNKIYKNKNYLEKTAKNYLEKNNDLFNFDKPATSLLLGHSRKGSVGGKDLDNAHPFEIEIENDALIGVHNGTIKNWKELLKQYNLENNTITVDSQAIFTILANNKNNYSVFEKYEGAGTFIWFYKSDPSTIYLFKGASKEYRTSISVMEERPLFYYEDEEGTYFSSIKDSLSIIAPDKKKVNNINTNIVYVIKNNIIISKTNINRPGIFYEPQINNHVSNDNVRKINDYKENKIKCISSTQHLKNKTSINYSYKLNNIIMNGIYIINSLTGLVYHHFKDPIVSEDELESKIAEIKKKNVSTYISPVFIIKGRAIYNNYNAYVYTYYKAKELIKESIISKLDNKELVTSLVKLYSLYSLHPVSNVTTDLYFDGILFSGSFKFLFPSENVEYSIKEGIYQKSIINVSQSFVKCDNLHSLNIQNELENARLEWKITFMFNDSKLDYIKNNLKTNIILEKQIPDNYCCNVSHEKEEINKNKDEDQKLYLEYVTEECELLEIYNELVKKTKKIKNITDNLECLKIKEYKQNLSYVLNDWILTTVNDILTISSSDNIYTIDNDKDSYSTLSYKKNLLNS